MQTTHDASHRRTRRSTASEGGRMKHDPALREFMARNAKVHDRAEVVAGFIVGMVVAIVAGLEAQIAQAQDKTQDNTGLILNVAANYGGRWDIIQAAQKLAEKVESGEISSSQMTEEALNQHLSMQNQSEVDLMIRTGGDYRISNFILWQAAYAELVFTETLWPDFDEKAFHHALATFASRQRRFGLTGSQIEEIRAL